MHLEPFDELVVLDLLFHLLARHIEIVDTVDFSGAWRSCGVRDGKFEGVWEDIGHVLQVSRFATTRGTNQNQRTPQLFNLPLCKVKVLRPLLFVLFRENIEPVLRVLHQLSLSRPGVPEATHGVHGVVKIHFLKDLV